ncbi:uncharacterized protein LOC144665602 [Oculina patagonica]
MAEEMAKEDAKIQPLVIFYDSEAANGNVYRGDIIEIAAKCHPDVVKGSFQSLINTKQPLCAFATRECEISEEDLKNKPCFKEILMKFVSWIDDMVKLAKKRHGTPFLPVLCAHYGYQFDFLILLSNMERSGLNHSILTQHNIHFADSLLFCSELKDNGDKLLANTRLSLDALFKKFFPKKILKDRHRAMGDVDGMVKIFTQTPLRKLLHHMKYSSTKDRLEYYISQSGCKQQQAILEEKFCKLDACSKNMSIKKLLKEGVTYNSLRKIFEECCSFLDFYETMKTYGIERKVSKVMALHFSGQGLQNQGARAFARLHEEKPTQVSSEHQELGKTLQGDRLGQNTQQKMSVASNLQQKPTEVSSEDQENGKALHSGHPEQNAQPKMSASSNLQDAKSPNQAEATEDWESEVATAAPRRDFTLKCTTPTPLSLGVEDFSSAQPEKTTRRETSRGKPQAKIDHSHSEKHDKRNAEVTDTRPQGKAKKVEVRDRSTFNAPKQFNERNSRWKKPFKESRQEGRVKKEAVFSKRGNKNEAIKKKTLKSTDAYEGRLDVEESKPSVSSVPSEETKPRTKPGELSCEENCSSAERPCEKSQPPAVVGLDGDSSMADGVQKFTSVFIGDIAILVPVENSEEADSNGVELNESDSHIHDQAEEVTNCSKVSDNLALHQSLQGPLETQVQGPVEATVIETDKVVKSPQLNQESSSGNAIVPTLTACCQSECGASRGHCETHATEQVEPAVNESNKVMDTLLVNIESSEGNAVLSSKLPPCSQSEQDIPPDRFPETSVQYQAEEASVTSVLNLEQPSGNDMLPERLASSIRAEKTGHEDVTTSLTSNNLTENFIHADRTILEGRDKVMEETDHQYASLPTDVTSITGQDPTCLVKNDSCHDKSAIEGSNGMGFPWEDLQQMPCSSLPDNVPLAPSDASMYGSFVMNQGLASHFMTTDDMDQAHRDLQAELSSESSSTSGEQPMELFSRQPPLGAERGYTPDAVQQQPSQPDWLGNASDGLCQMTLGGPGINNFNQTSFPSLSNPYGTFPQSQQALPLLKPCYPPFAYPNHVRQAIPPQMMHPPQQVFMPPFQYRNQMMFSSMVPPSVGFPALPPSQFPPQMFPMLPAAAGYSCSSIPFGGNPYEQAQLTSGTTVDVNGAVLLHPTNTLSEGRPDVDDYGSPTMDSNGSLGSDEREDSSSEFSSSDSSLEIVIASAASQVYDNSAHAAQESFPIQVKNDSGFSSVSFEGNQKETNEEQKEKGTLSGNVSVHKNDEQVFSLAHLCYKEVLSDEVYLNKLKDTSCSNRSKDLFSQQHSEEQEDPVNKQITILSREESGIAMGRRLSPDGSSVEGVCFDLSSDTSSVQNNETVFKEKRLSTSYRHDLAEEYCSYRLCDVKEKGKEKRKDRSPSPKPQRVKGSRSRRNKNTQELSVSTQKDLHQPASGTSSQVLISGTCPDAQSVSTKETYDSCKQKAFGSGCENNASQKTQTDRKYRRVRFSKEDTEHQSSETSKTSDSPRQANPSIAWQEKEKEGIKLVKETRNGVQSITDVGGSQKRPVHRTVNKTTKVEGHWVHEGSGHKNKPVEKGVNADIRPTNIRAGNRRKRGYNDKMKRPLVKEPLDVKKPEAETRTDKNNNSK